MQIGSIIKATQLVVKHNAPAILTAVAVAGTITTGLFAANAGAKASRAISREEIRHGHPISGPAELTVKEKVRIVWPLFMPAVGMGVLTVACTIGANHIGGRRAAALAGAYSLSEKAFSEYKDKVTETIGKKKEEKVRDAVAQDQVTRNPPTTTEIVITDTQDVVCYDAISGRYFTTSMEKLHGARNDLNKQILDDGYASLNEFWDLLGLDGTTIGEELGWSSDHLLELHITTTLAKDGKPCLSLGYIRAPEANYYKAFH